MPYNNQIVTVKVILPDGYYDDYEDLTEEGRATIIDVCEEADFTLVSIEQ